MSQQRARILIVDDDVSMRLLLLNICQNLGCEALAVENGEVALEACERNHFDLLLLDVNMPGMEGHETAFRIRQTSGPGRPAILMVSAAIDPAMRALCFDSGADGFFPKPISIFELSDEINRCLRKARMLAGVG
jgi:CheY-like chemotaxis protein